MSTAFVAKIKELLEAQGQNLSEDNMTDGLPASKAETILSAPGVGELKTASNAGNKATPPDKDPKAKSSSPKFPAGNQNGMPALPGAGKTMTGGMMEDAEEEGEEIAETSETSDEVVEEEKDKKKFPFNPFKKAAKKDEGDDDDSDDKKNDSDDEDDADDDKKKSGKKKMPPFFAKKGGDDKKDMKENVLDGLFEGEELSEDFKTKASTLFEAAIVAKEQELSEAYETLFEEALAENVDIIRGEIVDHLDSYLNYVVEQWMEENRLEVESGLKNEIAESFMTGLRNLFAEHYIEVPEGKVDIVESLTIRNQELEDKLSEVMNENIEMTDALVTYRKQELVSEQCDGLADTQFEKFATLCEGIEYENDEDYAGKIAVIKESLYSNTTSNNSKKTDKKATTKVLTEQTGDESDGTTVEPSTVQNAEIVELAKLLKA